MKTWIISLLILLAVLQWELWFSDGGVITVLHLKKELDAEREKNQRLTKRNSALEAQVNELKHGQQALEEHARTDLGMLGRDETFYQIIEEPKG